MSSSRRGFIKQGAAALAALSLPVPAAAGWPAYPRIAVVGGGLAGVACAWLLDGVADAVVFEPRAALGGHADTIPVQVDGELIQVDVGAQFFAPGPHPTYVRLLEHIGLLTPVTPDTDATVEAEMTITVSEAGVPEPRFVSPAAGRAWTLLAPWNLPALLAFLKFVIAARQLERFGSWLRPLDDWLDDLAVDLALRENLLLPLLSAMVGCTIEQARGLSARNAVAFIAQALPEKLTDPIRYANSLLGLGGNVAYLASLAGNLDVRLNAAVTAVRAEPGGRYAVDYADGLSESFDGVVFAAPPHATAQLLDAIPWHRHAAALLGGLEYFDSEIAIHRDPVYMPSAPALWSAYNAHRAGGRCEASVWYGALRPPGAGGQRLALFKSWASARDAAPQQEIHRRAFRHPLVTPQFIVAQRALLRRYQGVGRVWYAGSWTREVDSQETALRSAMVVVADMFPQAPNLLALS